MTVVGAKQINLDQTRYYVSDHYPSLLTPPKLAAQFNNCFRFAAGALGKLQQWCEAVGRDWVQGGKTAARRYRGAV